MARIFLPALLIVLIVGGAMFAVISRRAPAPPAPAPAASETVDPYADLDVDALIEDELLTEPEVTDADLSADADAALDADESALTEVIVDVGTRPQPATNTNTNAPAPAPAQTVRAAIVANDLRFTPAEVRAPRGARVELTFQVAEEEVYYGGLSIRSSVFNTGPIAKGASKTVSFTADQSFTFSSYWPTSGVKKADGQLIVE